MQRQPCNLPDDVVQRDVDRGLGRRIVLDAVEHSEDFFDFGRV